MILGLTAKSRKMTHTVNGKYDLDYTLLLTKG
jgi:hypothetical protein